MTTGSQGLGARQPDDGSAGQQPAAADATPVGDRVTAARRLLDAHFAVSDTPRGLVKRVLLPPARALTGHLVGAVDALSAGLVALERRVDSGERSAAARSDDLETRIRHLEARVRELEDGAVAVRAASAVGAATADGDRAATVDDVLDTAGYAEFERRFRGSREEILERQRDAVKHVAELAGGDDRLLDLGCGRGEWLEVLRETGVPAFGVDANEEMVGIGREQGLDLRHGDLVSYLEGIAPGTLGAVTGFHVAEHLPLPVLGRVLASAFRALRPGGILLMETPNPLNVVVGSASFYLDPTHLRPVHPFFFQFLVEQHGFTDVELHYVHPADERLVIDAGETAAAPDRVVEALSHAVFGAQDYLVVARRGAHA